ncbi:MAG: four helix bundle protein [Saprospiraceae bacterium]|nr:four helix bundle protein [Candidatus Parvibacillus calidus]
MKESIVKDRSFKFALGIIEIYKRLQEQNEYVLSKQLLRSGTSIGANINEALAGESRADFKHKMSIASKEARETKYWLELLEQSQLREISFKLLIQESQELINMLTSIVKTTKKT